MKDFFSSVCDYIDSRQLLPPKSPVIAGVSGGADSMALLLVLDRLCDPLGLELTVAHLNHGLRGDCANGDEDFVRSWCLEHGRKFVSHLIDVRQLASDQGIGLEEAGRMARMAFFNELADRSDANGLNHPPAIIALAHHMDDQAETMLLHLGRGCGLDGLCGMKAKTGRLVRPLLSQSRAAIEAWLRSQNIIWRQDATNTEYFALRNRLRGQVLPAWAEALGYNPAPLLARTALSLEEDRQFIDALAAQATEAIRREDGWHAAAIAALPIALQNRVLRHCWIEKTGSGKDLSFTHVQLIRNWLPGARDLQMLSLPGGWRMIIDNGLLKIEPLDPVKQKRSEPHQDPADSLQADLRLPTAYGKPALTQILQLNLQIAAELIENEDQIVYNDTTEYFRLDRIRGSVIRFRMPGDRIRPQGRNGSKTLKKFLNELKIPQKQRDHLLLLALDQSIIWLPGFAAGTDFLARPGDRQSGRVVRLTIGYMPSQDA